MAVNGLDRELLWKVSKKALETFFPESRIPL
jgi:hypothetical protein